MTSPSWTLGPRREHQQDNGIGKSYRPLQPRRPIFNLCHAAQYRTIYSAEKLQPMILRQPATLNFSAESIVRY